MKCVKIPIRKIAVHATRLVKMNPPCRRRSGSSAGGGKIWSSIIFNWSKAKQK